jgi:arylformamidase
VSDVVYGAYTRRELDEQYDTSLPAGGDVQPYFERFEAESAKARAELPFETNLRYGRHGRELFDYLPAKRGAPLFVWIHGGYWRRFSKEATSFVAAVPAAAGAAVALVNYPLAPEATLDEIVASVRAAHGFAVARASEGDAPPSRIVVGGHSVGAQLAATVAAVAPLDGLLGISGLYDLEPLRHTKINETIAMDAATAARNAPIHLPPRNASRLVLSAGEREQAEFHRQQADYAAAWRSWGGDVTEVPAPGLDHFSIALELTHPESALSRALLGLLFTPKPPPSAPP